MKRPPNLSAASSPGTTSPTLPVGPAVDRLERLLLEQRLSRGDLDSHGLEKLRGLGNPPRLAFLCAVLLGTLLRRGPRQGAGSLSVGDLLASVSQAATEGCVPLANSLQLRRTLKRAEECLRQGDAWHDDAPPWWQPLPPVSPQESLLTDLSEKSIHLPEAAACASALGESSQQVLAGLLAPGWCQKIHQQLEAAWTDGSLALEPGAVGASGRVTTRRSDLVRYITGLEQDALVETPALATLVQWGLEHLERFLRRALPGQPIFAPQQAMLTRYPAPSGGYEVHIDNPGGDDDNGRQLTLVLYLNAPEQECSGGELALWETAELGEPVSTVPARGGNAVVFESRAIPHQVLPLGEGPARWALTFWFSDSPQHAPAPAPPPPPSLTELLLPVENPPLPPQRLLFHELPSPSRKPPPVVGEILVQSVTRAASSAASHATARPAIVATVYRGGAFLEAWCEHHLSMGFVHLLLVFDHLEEAEEAALAKRLQQRHGPSTLTIWSGQALAEEGWPSLGGDPQMEDLRRAAGGGASSVAHAARQSLNASVALEWARGDSLDAPPDWLLHLDADELFYLQGRGRGGANAREHFSTARSAGLRQIRYVNHELLLPHQGNTSPRFKMNPRLAAAHLGANGWRALVRYLKMEQEASRPYFRAYHNGKSAVVVDAACSAAGVHGWQVEAEAPGREAALAGPSILHFHLPTAESFRRAYLAKAQETVSAPVPPFAPSPLEVAALECARSLANAPTEELHKALEALYRRKTFFDEGEAEILTEAGLVLTPDLPALRSWTTK